jgi:NCS1 family nucleobase:cation symporter-1
MGAKGVLKRLEAEHPEGLTNAEMFLASRDLLPVPEAQKTWGYMSFVSAPPGPRATERLTDSQVSFWIADSFK